MAGKTAYEAAFGKAGDGLTPFSTLRHRAMWVSYWQFSRFYKSRRAWDLSMLLSKRCILGRLAIDSLSKRRSVGTLLRMATVIFELLVLVLAMGCIAGLALK